MPRYPLAGVTEFIKLLDTPAAYSGQAGKVPAVNTGEDALEYATPMTGVKVRKNSGAVIATRPQLNFIEGVGVDLLIEDNPPDDEIDIIPTTSTPHKHFVLLPETAVLPVANPAAKASVDGANFSYDVLDFDPDTEESCFWEDFLSPDYDSENIVVDIYWITTDADTGHNVRWGIKVLGREKGEAWDAALGTEQLVTTPNPGAGLLAKSRIATFAPTWSPEDLILFKVARKAADGADTVDQDARVVKVVVSYTTSFKQSFYPLAEPVEITGIAVGSWDEVDAAAFGVPIGATGVILHVVHPSANEYGIGFRKKGSTDNRIDNIRPYSHVSAATGVDEGLKFEAYIGNAAIKVYLVAYTATGVVFFDNAYNKTPAQNAWNNVDVSAECPGAIGVILEITDTCASVPNKDGVRKDGSTDDLVETANKHSWTVIGVSVPGQIFEAFCQRVPQTQVYVMGYITSGAAFFTNAKDYSIGVADTWTMKDASGDCPKGNMLFFDAFRYAYADKVGFRKYGSTEEIYQRGDYRYWCMVACDMNQRVDVKVENTGVGVWLLGYATHAG